MPVGVIFALVIFAQDVQDPTAPLPEAPRLTGEWEVEIFPDRSIYAPYLADPRQSKTGTKLQFPVRHADESHIKIENTLGTYKPLAHWGDPSKPDEEGELYLEAAAFSRFDTEEVWDMDAVDYRFGFPFAYRYREMTAKLHIYHVTSHLGDEYISRTGAKRSSYHLEEAALGISWQVDHWFRVYGEIGIGVYVGEDTGSGRAQVGAEWVGPAWKHRLSPFAAVDLQTRNEIDWDVNGTFMAGLTARSKSGAGGYRFALEYYRGHDQQTQFKENREHYLALGIQAEF